MNPIGSTVQDPLDKILRCCKDIADIKDDLRVISGAFLVTGNEPMSKTLRDLSDKLAAANLGIREATMDASSDRVSGAEQSSKSTILAALAGYGNEPGKET